MNNILYICLQRDASTATALCYQMLNQSKENLLISIFDKTQSQLKDTLYNYFIDHSKNLKFLYDNKDTISNIIHNYPNYNWYMFLSHIPTYSKNFCAELFDLSSKTKNDIVKYYPHNNKDNIYNHSIFLSRTVLTQYAQKHSHIKDIVDLVSDSHIIPSPLLGCVDVSNKNILENADKNYTFYEDELCLFANFSGDGTGWLLDSYVYMNKKNNKLYNIYNNIIGNIVDKKQNTIVIKWQQNNEVENYTTLKYRLNVISKQYVVE